MKSKAIAVSAVCLISFLILLCIAVPSLRHFLILENKVKPYAQKLNRPPGAVTVATSLQSKSVCDQPLPENVPLTPLTANNTPKAIANYAAFHARARACLLSANCTDKPQLLIWGCQSTIPCHGLGDRMRGIRLAFLLSILTNRLFLIRWPTSTTAPYDITAVLQPAAIDWRLPHHHVNNLLPGVRATAWQWNFKGEGKRYRLQYGDWMPFDLATSDFRDMHKDVDVLWLQSTPGRKMLMPIFRGPHGVAMFPEIQKAELPDVERHLMHPLFRPTAQLEALVKEATFANGVPYASVHARLGQDVDEGDLSRFQYRISHMEEAADKLLKRTLALSKDIQRTAGGNRLQVFLASDSLSFKKLFVELGERNGLTVHTRLKRVLHVGKSRYSTHLKDIDDVEQCQAYLEVFVDLIALGRGESIVFLQSGFPRNALSAGSVNQWCEVRVERKVTVDKCFRMQPFP